MGAEWSARYSTMLDLCHLEGKVSASVTNAVWNCIIVHGKNDCSQIRKFIATRRVKDGMVCSGPVCKSNAL